MTDFDQQPVAGMPGLPEELRALTSSLAIAEPDQGTVGAVLARLEREPTPTAPGPLKRVGESVRSLRVVLQKRWRIAGVALAALLALVLAVTPAGAKVMQWLGFGAVVVEQQSAPTDGSGAPGTSESSTAADGREVTLEQAVAGSSFPIGVPTALGVPDRIIVSPDGRLVSMEWTATPQASTAGSIRLDQIGGSLSPYFVKKIYQDVEFTAVDGAEALWLSRPHPIVVLNSDGSERAESARLSGPSLVWQDPDVTLRLEGVTDRASALAIAESVRQ